MPTPRRSRSLLALVVALPLTLAVATHGAVAAVATPTGSICDFVVPASASPGPTGMPSTEPVHATPTVASNQLDLVLLDLLTAHLEAGVATAQIAVDRAEHPELRDFAAQLIAEQTGWLAQLQGWRDAWYPNAEATPFDHATALVNGLIAGMLDMPASPVAAQDASAAVVVLCSASGSFDAAYLDLAIPHLQALIAVANVGLENGTHPELKTLEGTLIDTIQKELDQLTAWQSSWA